MKAAELEPGWSHRRDSPLPTGARLGDDLDILAAWREVQSRSGELELAKAALRRAEHHLAYARRQGALKAGAILPSTAR